MTVPSRTWMPLYVADYLRDTMHLSAIEHGAYLLLIMAAWNAGGELPVNDRQLAAIARCTPKQWRSIKETVLDFFQIDSKQHCWRHKRVDLELELARSITEARANAAAKRWQNVIKPDANAYANACANAMQTGSPSQSQSQIDNLSSERLSDAHRSNGHVKRSRGSRLPSDWEPSEQDCAFASDLGLDPIAVRDEFRAYWCALPGAKATKLDWSATYQNRCRELGRRNGHQRPGAGEPRADSFLAGLRKL